MKKAGICFFTDYRLPVPLLVVALHSLQKNFNGNIHVVCGKDTPKFFILELEKQDRITFEKTILKYPSRRDIVRIQRCFNIKPQIHKICPFKVNMVYDCDHLFVNKFDLSVFDLIRSHELISFHYPKEERLRKSNRRAWKRTKILKQYGMEVDFLWPMNGGCVGSVKDSPLIDEWVDTLDIMINLGSHIFRRLPDEYSLSYVMGRHNIPIGDQKWSYSVKKEDASDAEDMIRKVIAIHFPRWRYSRSRIYKKAVKEARGVNFLGFADKYSQYAVCNSFFNSLR